MGADLCSTLGGRRTGPQVVQAGAGEVYRPTQTDCSKCQPVEWMTNHPHWVRSGFRDLLFKFWNPSISIAFGTVK